MEMNPFITFRSDLQIDGADDDGGKSCRSNCRQTLFRQVFAFIRRSRAFVRVRLAMTVTQTKCFNKPQEIAHQRVTFS